MSVYEALAGELGDPATPCDPPTSPLPVAQLVPPPLVPDPLVPLLRNLVDALDQIADHIERRTGGAPPDDDRV